MGVDNQVFSAPQRTLLTAVLDRIIPANGALPAAGELGVGTFVENVAGGDPQLTRLFNEGLRQIEIEASQESDSGFTALAGDAQDSVLRGVEASAPVFFEQLVRQTYNGYYTSPRVFEHIGYELPGPPVPGAQPELLDESLLDKQRRRAPFWTKV
ncbi:MAG: hypothetical protein BZY88_09365 [SAR202 cluster bacterium Io17-Chloro-G9]|nr:MAG: hypothetical protein BZY88_09365 [SAR202 cluster bacterium Io17-Chloro-G9]